MQQREDAGRSFNASEWYIFIYFTIRYPSEQKQEEKAISHHTYMYILLNSVY